MISSQISISSIPSVQCYHSYLLQSHFDSVKINQNRHLFASIHNSHNKNEHSFKQTRLSQGMNSTINFSLNGVTLMR